MKWTMLILLVLAFSPAAYAQEADAAEPPSSEHAPGETDALTAAWKLEPQGLDADIAKMTAQWDAVEAQLADAAHIKIRAGKVSRWSVGQQSLHILKVAGAIGGQVPRLLDSAPPAANAPTGSPMKAMALASGFPRGVAQAPQGLGVHYQPDLEEIREALKKTREIWNAAIDRKDEIPASTATFPHPVFGPMNAAEWLRFTTVHTSHHLKIIEDILADHATRTAGVAPAGRSGSGAFATAAGSAKPASTGEAISSTAKPGPPVFAVALLDIQDRAEYSKYEMGFLPILAKYDGQVLAVDESVFAIEGEWAAQRTVILRFPDRASLDRWYASPEYQRILPHRHASSTAKIAIVKGFKLPG